MADLAEEENWTESDGGTLLKKNRPNAGEGLGSQPDG